MLPLIKDGGALPTRTGPHQSGSLGPAAPPAASVLRTQPDPGHITPQHGHMYQFTSGDATVVRSVQALEGVAAHSKEVEGVSVAAEELQSAQSSHVQLLQAGVPYVQLDDVDQLLWVSHSHRLNLVQPER